MISIDWGILGCAEIAKKNIRALKLSGNSQIKAIASRRKFIFLPLFAFVDFYNQIL